MFFGVVMGLLASASWAAANVFVQRSGRLLGSVRALVWTQLLGIVAMLPVMLLAERRPSLPVGGAGWAWLVVAAAAALLAYTSMFHSMERGRLSIVVPVMSSWSVVAAALSIGVLGETLRRKHLAGAGLVVAGVLIVSRFSVRDAGGGATSANRATERRALLAAAGAALGFGVLIPSIDRLAPFAGRLGAIPLVYALDLLLGLPLLFVRRFDVRPPSLRALPVVGAAAIFETAGFVWISLGVAGAPVSIVSPLASLASAFTVLYAWVVLGERPPRPVLLGAALACAGVITLSF